MLAPEKILFITASHKEEILKKYLLESYIFKLHTFPLIIQRGYTNVPKAYNDIKKSNFEIFVYVHQDVFLPPDFEYNLRCSLDGVEEIDKDWAVLGSAGVLLKHWNKDSGLATFPYGNIKDRNDDWSGKYDKGLPHKVDTLDECILITHGDFIFDENIPGNHFYGADICLQAKKQGRKCYALDAYLHHNSQLKVGERPPDFYTAKEYIRNKWKDMLPIATTCTIIK